MRDRGCTKGPPYEKWPPRLAFANAALGGLLPPACSYARKCPPVYSHPWRQHFHSKAGFGTSYGALVLSERVVGCCMRASSREAQLSYIQRVHAQSPLPSLGRFESWRRASFQNKPPNMQHLVEGSHHLRHLQPVLGEDLPLVALGRVGGGWPRKGIIACL